MIYFPDKYLWLIALLWLLTLSTFVFVTNKDKKKSSKRSHRSGQRNMSKRIGSSDSHIQGRTGMESEFKRQSKNIEELQEELRRLEELLRDVIKDIGEIKSDLKTKEMAVDHVIDGSQTQFETVTNLTEDGEKNANDPNSHTQVWEVNNQVSDEKKEWFFIDARDSRVKQTNLFSTRNQDILYRLEQLDEDKALIDLVDNKDAWVNALQSPQLYVDTVCKYEGVATSKQKVKLLRKGEAKRISDGWEVTLKVEVELH